MEHTQERLLKLVDWADTQSLYYNEDDNVLVSSFNYFVDPN